MDDELEGLCVLAVEDNALNETTLALMLRRIKTKFQIVRSGVVVLQTALGMEELHLILLDIGLPHLDGYQVLKQLRAEPRLDGVKIVAMSARDPRVEIERSKAAGFDGYITKPLRQSIFGNQLRRIMEGDPIWDEGS
jgi:CheY-like chemotaxis protein